MYYSDALTHTPPMATIICARKEEKILPSPVIKQALEAKTRNWKPIRVAAEEDEKDSEGMKYLLLLRAFSRFSQTMM